VGTKHIRLVSQKIAALILQQSKVCKHHAEAAVGFFGLQDKQPDGAPHHTGKRAPLHHVLSANERRQPGIKTWGKD
jgi:hypothetical protein